MKVLIVTLDLNGPGGVAHYYKAVKPHLPNYVNFLFIGKRYKSWNLPSCFRLVVDVFNFLFSVNKYDLIHLNPSLKTDCFFRDLIFIMIAKVFKKQVIVFFRGWDISFEQKVDKKFKNLFRTFYCKVDCIVVLADHFAKKVCSWGYSGPVYCETTTVDERLLESLNRDKININKKITKILFLSRIEKAKGIYEIIDAARRLDQYPLKFIIGGDGSEMANLQKYLNKHPCNNVTLTGYLKGDHKINTYLDSDIFLFPSYHAEGMPNSILEAMAFGLPIITCCTGGIADFFADEKMGYIIRPESVDDIVNKLKLILANPEVLSTMSVYNLNYARDRFYSGVVANRLLGIYESTNKKV